jgi:hypothetical protein
MASKKSPEGDPLALRMVEALERVEGELKGFRSEFNAFRKETGENFAEVHAKLTGISNELTGLRSEARVDVVKLTREHDDRLLRLEAAVFKTAAE